MTRHGWLTLIGAVVLLGTAAFLSLTPSEAEFHDYVSGRRAAGKPASYSDLRPEPPDAENCAPDLDAAFDALLDEHDSSLMWKMSERLDEATPEELAELVALVTRMRPGLVRLSAALAKPKFWMRTPVLEFEKSGLPVRGHSTFALSLSWAFSMSADSEPDSSRRLAAIRDEFALASKVTPDTWNEFWACGKLTGAAISSLRRGVETGVIDAVAARREFGALLAEPVSAALSDASRGEPVNVIELYGAVLEGRADRFRHSVKWRLTRRFRGEEPTLFVEMDVPDMHRGMAAPVVELCRAYEVLATLDASRLVTSEGAAALATTPGLEPLGSAFTRLTQRAIQMEAERRLARIALAAAEHHAQTGTYPASLDELRAALGGDVPLDPYSGKAFLFEPTASGLRLSSAGHKPPDQDTPNTRDLLIWELKR